jgi:hypothetical protein
MCVCVCMYICIYIHTHIYTCNVYMYICMYVYIYIASSCDCEGVYAMMCVDIDGVVWSAVIATSASASNLRLHTLVA